MTVDCYWDIRTQRHFHYVLQQQQEEKQQTWLSGTWSRYSASGTSSPLLVTSVRLSSGQSVRLSVCLYVRLRVYFSGVESRRAWRDIEVKQVGASSGTQRRRHTIADTPPPWINEFTGQSASALRQLNLRRSLPIAACVCIVACNSPITDCKSHDCACLHVETRTNVVSVDDRDAILNWFDSETDSRLPIHRGQTRRDSLQLIRRQFHVWATRRWNVYNCQLVQWKRNPRLNYSPWITWN